MITYVDFSLFDSPCKVLVNTVNTVGVMGKGIAKEFKGIYPEMFTEYQSLCERGLLDIGNLWIYPTSNKWVLNFPTKKHWRSPSKPEYLEAGLQKFARIYQEARVASISFPMLGCGNGELDWEDQVKPRMEHYLRPLPIEIFIHMHTLGVGTAREHRVPAATKKWLRSQPQSLAFTEVWDDLVDMVKSTRQFTTTGDKAPFTAEIFRDEEGGGIRINSGGAPVFLHKEQLLDLWQQIRGLGLCIPDIMPSGLDMHSEYVLPLLAELPYMKSVRQANKDTRLTKRTTGLLLTSYLKEPSVSVQVGDTVETGQMGLAL